MKTMMLSLALMLAALQNPEPPKDAWCDNHPKTPAANLCKCHRICYYNPDTKQIEEQEDPACAVYCKKDQCQCASECDTHDE